MKTSTADVYNNAIRLYLLPAFADPASIPALAAIFGSLTGALASSVSTWITQRHQDRHDILAKTIF